MSKKLKLTIMGISFISIIFLGFLACNVSAQTKEIYFPSDDWITTTPEDQGMNSKLINELYEFIDNYNLNIQSILVSRNGFIVNESYLYDAKVIEEQKFITPSPEITRKNGTLHVLYSCTKSMVSLLVGIAIDKGYINSVNDTFFGIFPDKWDPIYGDETKKNITIEDLLTMRSGFQWDEWTDTFLTWWQYNNSLDYVLKKPLAFPPGSWFEYSSGNTHLISAIIQNKTGMKTSEFARQNLFTPIGIKDDEWEWDENSWEWGTGPLENISYGGWGLFMTPRAMTRIGLLCLTNGNWNGTQLIPESYITSATSKHVQYPPYGYSFWLKNGDYYYAAGYLGQFLVIIPEYNIVLAIFSESDYIEPALNQIINDFIIKAVISLSNPQISGYNLLIIIGIVSLVFFSKIRRKKAIL